MKKAPITRATTAPARKAACGDTKPHELRAAEQEAG
jgi:hypothetical protein